MFLQYRYPLEPSRAQHTRLRSILRLQRHLYNAALENRRHAWEAGRRLTYQDDSAALPQYRRENPEQAALPWGVNNWTLRRLDFAMAACARRVDAGEDPGLPRFRSEARWRSFGVHGVKGWTLRNDRLCLDGLTGALRIRMHQPLAAGSNPIGVALTCEARRWFVTIMIAVEAAAKHPKPETACGVDASPPSRMALTSRTSARPSARQLPSAGQLERWHDAKKDLAGAGRSATASHARTERW